MTVCSVCGCEQNSEKTTAITKIAKAAIELVELGMRQESVTEAAAQLRDEVLDFKRIRGENAVQ